MRPRGGGGGASGSRLRFRLVLTVVAGVVLGLPGLWIAASGGGPAGTPGGRLLGSAAYFVVAGFAVGLLAGGGRRAYLASLVAWGPALLGATGTVLALSATGASGGLALALLYLTFPAGLALAGGWLGGRLGGRVLRAVVERIDRRRKRSDAT